MRDRRRSTTHVDPAERIVAEYRLPELGEGVYEAELVEWRVKPGDAVKRGETLAEVLTDKATMELPSPFVGVIESLGANPGEQVKVGDVFLTYSSSSKSGRVGTESQPTGTSPPQVQPATGGEAETDRDGRGAAKPEQRSTARKTAPEHAAVKAAPSVRRKARELGVDLDSIAGSGPGGRVLAQDVEAARQNELPQTAKRQTATPRLTPVAADGRFGTPGERIKFHGLRRKIAERMVESKRTIPHYGYVDECNVTELVRLRNSLKETLARQGVKLTYLAFFVKAVVGALKEVPIVNSSLDETGGEIVLHDRYHIGVAVATPGGLIVPVLRDADRLDVPDIAREIERLSEAARTGSAKLEELRGSTFTITSIGGIGGLISAPVINSPEVGILGIGKVVRRPVYDEADHLQPAEMVYLSFSFDHRVLDGDVGATFGNAVIRRLENPAALLVE
jgi:pyruvate dehydrogenase E2 component (dihydrolipoamide acetyltransferase)/2-oxoisovalerate dehydrogenase E2 component (dihydrolipoyl transacylase)